MKSKFGLALSGVYVLVSAYLIGTQGLTGESFIALILGMPWSFLLSAFEFGGTGGFILEILLILPVAVNAIILYCIGSFEGKRL